MAQDPTGGTGLWDEERVKALLHFPRYPVRLIQEEPWQTWITQRGGLRAVYEFLQSYSFSPSHRRILEVVLSNPEEISDVYASRLNVSRATYFYRLRELLPAVVHALNHWSVSQPSPDAEKPRHSVTGSMPAPLTSLVGVDAILHDLGSLLLREDVRLLTLLGPGGVGKTRLAIELAHRVREAFPGEIRFVDLSPLHLPDAVLPAVARSLDLEPHDEAGIAAFLTKRHALLLLDNFEHLLPESEPVAGLLSAAPLLKVLVTSRAPLRIYGEYEYVIPPLPTLAQAEPLDLEAIAASPAVALFVQRAQAVNPGFRLTSANAEAVAELCARMDGIPLAIELAAYQAKTYSPQAMLVRLSNARSLSFLSSGPKRPHPHQQTPRDILDWSYRLLPPDLQVMFSRLSVFAGGCTAEAAEVVCAETPLPAASGLAALAEQSLLQPQFQPDGEPRYQMLGITREYALELLARRGETLDRQRAHAGYFLALAEQAPLHADREARAGAIDLLGREYANLSAAIEWVVDHQEAATALRLVSALEDYWRATGMQPHGYQMMQRVLAQTGDLAEPVRAQVFRRVGWLALDRCDTPAMAWAFQSAVRLSDALGDAGGMARARLGLAETARIRGDWAEAQTHIAEALAWLEAKGEPGQIAQAKVIVGRIAFCQGNLENAQPKFEDGIATFSALHDDRARADAACWLAQTLYYRGRVDEAALVAAEALRLNEISGGQYELSSALAHHTLAATAIHENRFARARESLDACLVLSRQIGYAGCIELAQATAALLAAEEGDPVGARTAFRESLLLQESIQEPWRVVELIEAVAMFLVASGEALSAARLFGAAQSLRDQAGIARFARNRAPYEASQDRLREQLDAATLGDAWAAGYTLTLGQTIAYALRCLE